MTPKEAYKILKNTFITTRGSHVAYSKALHLAMAALEKQIPKKPIFRKQDKKVFADCPNCNETLTYEDKIKANFCKFNYCFRCGQALDWSDT